MVSDVGGGVGEAGEWLLLCEGSAGIGPVANKRENQPSGDSAMRKPDRSSGLATQVTVQTRMPVVCPKVYL